MSIQGAREHAEIDFYQECIPISNYARSAQETIAFRMLENEGMSVDQIVNKLGLPPDVKEELKRIYRRY